MKQTFSEYSILSTANAEDPGTTKASHRARVPLRETEARQHLVGSSSFMRTVALSPAVLIEGRAPRLGLRSS